MRCLATVAVRVFAAAGVLGSAPLLAQECRMAGEGQQRIEGERHVLAWRTQPGKPAVGRHFAVEFLVCPKAGVAAPESVRVDAHMPEHRHGMNYQPQLKTLADGVRRAEGLMFHMPGRWEFIFELRAGGRTDRLTQRYTLE